MLTNFDILFDYPYVLRHTGTFECNFKQSDPRHAATADRESVAMSIFYTPRYGPGDKCACITRHGACAMG